MRIAIEVLMYLIFSAVAIFMILTLLAYSSNSLDNQMKQLPCSAFANSSVSEIPARCIKSFTDK